MTQCFAIFEGGGAKGLAHVGALKAAEKQNLEFIGIAGASAGAIIAALVAAGFKADELFCPDPAKRATTLFARVDWVGLLEVKRWRAYQGLTRDLTELSSRVTSPGIRPAIKAAIRAWGLKRKWMDQIKTSVARKGFFSTDTFEAWLDRTLAERLGLEGGDVTFARLYKESHKILKVVAVDILKQELVIYSHLSSPNVRVAKAVAASSSIPFFFAPTIIDNRAMVDGGLMSNFPAWLFELERSEYPPFIRTYGFTLVDAAASSLAPGGLLGSIADYTRKVVQAGVFGGQTMLNDPIELFHVVPIASRFDALAFELNDEQKTDLYTDGLNSASKYFRDHAVADDVAITVALKVLSDKLRELINLPLEGLRANISLPVATEHLRVTYSYNMENDTDDRLRLQRGQTGTGDVLQRKKAIQTDIRQIRSGSTMRGLNKYDSALVRKDMISLISVPIFGADHEWGQLANLRSTPIAVLAFDCNEDILSYFDRHDIIIFFEHSSILLGRLLRGELLPQGIRATTPWPKSLIEASNSFVAPTGTSGNRMQPSDDPTEFNEDFSNSLLRLARRVEQGIAQYGREGRKFR
jgi:NTE family protein